MGSSAPLCPGSSLLRVRSPPAQMTRGGALGAVPLLPQTSAGQSRHHFIMSAQLELPVTACDAREIRTPQPLPPTLLLNALPFFLSFSPQHLALSTVSLPHCNIYPLLPFQNVHATRAVVSICFAHSRTHRGHKGASTENMRHETGQHNLSDTPHSPPGKKPGGSAPALGYSRSFLVMEHFMPV